MKKYMLHNGFVVILAMTMHVLQATNGPSDDPWASWGPYIQQQQQQHAHDSSFRSATEEYDDEILNNATVDITVNSSIATATNTNPDSQATEVMTTDDDFDDDLSDISDEDSDDDSDESW